MKVKHIECHSCSEARHNQDLSVAVNCLTCCGKGILIKIEEYLCNNCGKEIMKPGMIRNVGFYSEHKFFVSGGYDSYYLFDRTDYIFYICEKCLRDMFNDFKIKPQVIDHDDGEIPYEQDLKMLTERIIKDIIE